MMTRREIKDLIAKNEKLEARFWGLMFVLLLVLAGILNYHSQTQAEISMLRKEISAEQAEAIDRALYHQHLEEL